MRILGWQKHILTRLCSYLKPLVRELKIQNTGIITAYWRIIPAENGGPLRKSLSYQVGCTMLIFGPNFQTRTG